MKNKIFIILLMIFCLTSCSNNDSQITSSSNDYSSITPYIQVERNEEKTFKEINVNEYISKMENKDSFIMFFYMTTCGACNSAKEKLLIPYMQETSIMIYAMDIKSEENYGNLALMQQYQILDNTYYYLKDDGTPGMKTPTICIIDQGVTINKHLGYSENLLNIIKTYCYLPEISE
jgi:predicted bacteriocin transport accessory protein